MAVASTVKVILGSIAFLVFWVLAVFPAIPFLPIGRTAGTLLGAMLMVIFHVLTPEQAYDAIDLPILGLLFGTMVVSIYLERADLFKYLGILLTWRSQGPKDLLFRVCLVSAISSALFTNDTSCVVLTEFVLKIARQHKLPPHTLLLALASSANIGSAATPIGNPQNLVIAVKGKIPFLEFVVGVLPAVLVGIVVNVVILLCVYWRLLSSHNDVEDATSDVSENDVYSHRFSPATMSRSSLSVSQELIHDGTSIPGSAGVKDVETLRSRIHASKNEIQSVSSADHFETARYSVASKGAEATGFSQHMEEMVNSESFEVTSDNVDANLNQIIFGKEVRQKWLRLWRKMSVYLVTLGMLIALLLGLNMSWTALTAALALVVIDFKDARPCLEKVSYSLLIFFCGMFITVDGFNKTGIPSQLWVLVQPYAKVDHAVGIAILGLVILFLSNLASNVPTVLLLGAQVAASAAAMSVADEKKAWLILAWVSTVAGNLSLLGSAANLIVCEQARQAPQLSYDLTFWSHLKFGVPSTLIITAIGLTVIKG